MAKSILFSGFHDGGAATMGSVCLMSERVGWGGGGRGTGGGGTWEGGERDFPHKGRGGGW